MPKETVYSSGMLRDPDSYPDILKPSQELLACIPLPAVAHVDPKAIQNDIGDDGKRVLRFFVCFMSLSPVSYAQFFGTGKPASNGVSLRSLVEDLLLIPADGGPTLGELAAAVDGFAKRSDEEIIRDFVIRMQLIQFAFTDVQSVSSPNDLERVATEVYGGAELNYDKYMIVKFDSSFSLESSSVRVSKHGIRKPFMEARVRWLITRDAAAVFNESGDAGYITDDLGLEDSSVVAITRKSAPIFACYELFPL